MNDLVNPTKDQKYLTDWLEELPENTVINKGLTGCGATTLAIRQQRDTIIAVPFTALIVNKTEQKEHKDVLLGLYGESPDNFREEIAFYRESHTQLKIMTTYDSLPRVCSTLQNLGYNPYKEAHLVIDEWHLLLMSYAFRGEAIRGVLNEAKQFQAVTYLSATPVEEKFWFPEMQGLRKWEIEWPNAKPIRVHKVQTPSPVKTAAALCMNRIADGTRVNYHLFMNSVTGISDIISRAGLTPENCRVICADNRKNGAKLPEGFKISKPSDPVKQVNFYTSTCFEGCDLFDENGRTFIICDPNKPTTMLDISTSMLQICGRIRNSKFKGELTLIYNTTRYEECDSLDLYMKRIEDDIVDAHQIVAGLNQCPEKFRVQIAAKLRMVDAPFIRLEKGELVVDQNMINLDIINYRILHGDYKTCVNLENRMQWNGFDIERAYYADAKYVGLMSLTKLSFKECCEQYEANRPQKGTYCLCENETLIRLRNLCPEACEAVDKLGIEEIRRMKYNRSNIHRKVLAMCGVEQDVKIKRELDRRFNKWEKYSVSEIKKILRDVYTDVLLIKNPVATDLKRWYRIRPAKKDGKDAYIIEGDVMFFV